jgi:hypothetical protein
MRLDEIARPDKRSSVLPLANCPGFGQVVGDASGRGKPLSAESMASAVAFRRQRAVARSPRLRASSRGVCGALAALALALTGPSAAGAAESGSAKPSANVAAAEALFDRGRDLMAQGRVQEACLLFEESQRLDAGIGTQFNLAACYEAAGRFASAHTLFLEVAAAARARDQPQREQVAVARAQAVERKLSRLVIEVEPQPRAELTVQRDGNPVGPAQWGSAVPVDPGVHEVRAGGPGLLPWARKIDVGTSPVVYTVRVPALQLADRARAPCDPTSGEVCGHRAGVVTGPESHAPRLPRTIGLLALGAGVAGVGLGVGFAVHAHSKNESAEQAGCDDRGCPDQASLRLRRQAVAAGNWATLGAGIGIAGLATAGILFWALPGPDVTPKPVARVVPCLTPDLARLELVGRF